MKTIDVQNQPSLSLARTLEICLNGIRYRLFRSIITVVVIGVAIAFLMNVLCEGLSLQAVGTVARERTAQARLTVRWSARLAGVGTAEDLLREVAGAAVGSANARELIAQSGLSEAAFAHLQTSARAAVAYLAFFDALDYGQRRQLVREVQGVAIFSRLQPAAAQTEFLKTLTEQLPGLHLPTDAQAFAAFLANWPDTAAAFAQVQAGRMAAVARLKAACGPRTLMAVLSEGDGPGGDLVRQAGFLAFEGATTTAVATQAKQVCEGMLVEGAIESKELRKQLAAQIDKLPGDITPRLVWRLLRSRTEAERFQTQLVALKLPGQDLTPARLVALAKVKAREEALESALRVAGEPRNGWLGLGSRMTWLVLVSLLVCAVGISNAMLMTVTERFREIATLKCLGALDGFIMVLFILEAGLLGLVGGVGGALVGSLIGFGRMLPAFGNLLVEAFPVMAWLSGLGAALGVGIVLAAFAGVYPAYMAARLAPMEAMRIE
jgi:putative ABC transport system permease protein